MRLHAPTPLSWDLKGNPSHSFAFRAFSHLPGVFVTTIVSFVALQPMYPGRHAFTSIVYSRDASKNLISHCSGSASTSEIVQDCTTVPPFTFTSYLLIAGLPGGGVIIAVKLVSVIPPNVTSVGTETIVSMVSSIVQYVSK